MEDLIKLGKRKEFDIDLRYDEQKIFKGRKMTLNELDESMEQIRRKFR